MVMVVFRVVVFKVLLMRVMQWWCGAVGSSGVASGHVDVIIVMVHMGNDGGSNPHVVMVMELVYPLLMLVVMLMTR
jgi:hypothetical protein